MTELKQKLAKSMPSRRSIGSIYTKEKYLCIKLWVKEGGGCLLEGGVFSRTYSTSTFSHKYRSGLEGTFESSLFVGGGVSTWTWSRVVARQWG